jgi:hypothetical protein
LTADYDEEFVKSMDHVGRIHRNIKRKKSGINVEYVHINALFGYVSAGLLSSILDANLPKAQEKETIIAVNKLLWLQNDFFGMFVLKLNSKQNTMCVKQRKMEILKMSSNLKILVIRLVPKVCFNLAACYL